MFTLQSLNFNFYAFQSRFLKRLSSFHFTKRTLSSYFISKILKTVLFSADNKQIVEKLASEVEKAQLNDSEVQRLIDALLDKQNELRQWQKVRLNCVTLLIYVQYFLWAAIENGLILIVRCLSVQLCPNHEISLSWQGFIRSINQKELNNFSLNDSWINLCSF